jgi:hypothetical protein
MSTLQRIWRKRQNRFCLEARSIGGSKKGVGSWGRNGTMYAHMNKCIKKKMLPRFSIRS